MFACKVECLETAVEALDRSDVGPLAEIGGGPHEIAPLLRAALLAEDPKETLRLAREALKHSDGASQTTLLDRIQCSRGRVTFRCKGGKSVTFERIGFDEDGGCRMTLEASPLEEARVASCLFGLEGGADLFGVLREAVRRCEEARAWDAADDEPALELEIDDAELEAMEKEYRAEYETVRQGAHAAAVAQVEAWKGAGLTADRAARMHPPMRAHLPRERWNEFDVALKAELEAWKTGVPSLDEVFRREGLAPPTAAERECDARTGFIHPAGA